MFSPKTPVFQQGCGGILALVFLAVLFIGLAGEQAFAQASRVTYMTVKIDGLGIFYREAGSRANPTVLLLHGFPTSSQMFRNLMPQLADCYHVVAPDYPGYGNSSAPPADQFDYTINKFLDKQVKQPRPTASSK